MNLFKRIQSC